MNQTYKVGPSKSLKVYPGDKVDIEVWEYHEGNTGFGTTSTPLTTLVTMVAGAFGGVSGAGGDPGLIYNGVNSAINGFLPPGNQGSTRPAAYLNYILFDKNYKVLNMGTQLAPATSFTKQMLSFTTLNIKEAGYVFVYLSYDNDSNNWVYFDDLKVSHTKSNVLQYNEYYPFGLQANTSWTRDGNSNNFLYNDANELNQNSGWYETFFRGYDPTLGRFHQIDPLAHASSSFTPYSYAFNAPVSYNDPNGDYPEEVAIDLETSGGSGQAQDPFGEGPDFWSTVGSGTSSNNPNRLWRSPRMSDVVSAANAVKSGMMSLEEYVRIFGTEISDPQAISMIVSQAEISIGNNSITIDKLIQTGAPNPDLEVGGLLSTGNSVSSRTITLDSSNKNVSSSVVWIAGSILTVEDAYNNFVHDHKYYRTTRNARKGIYKQPGVVRSAQAAKYALRSQIIQGAGVAGTALMTGNAVVNMSSGQGTVIDGLDATVGSVGLVGSYLYYTSGISLPGVGQGVALYAWGRMWFDLGSDFGPSKWFGSDDKKWFR